MRGVALAVSKGQILPQPGGRGAGEDLWGEVGTWRAQFRRENLQRACPSALLGTSVECTVLQRVGGRGPRERDGKQMFQESDLGCRCLRIIAILTTAANRYRALTVP